MRLCYIRQVVVDAIMRLIIVEPKYARKWREHDEQAAQAPGSVATAPIDTAPIPSPARAFLSLSYNMRAITSMLISFAVGIYTGGVLDGALTLKLNDVGANGGPNVTLHAANPVSQTPSATVSTRKERVLSSLRAPSQLLSAPPPLDT